METPMIKVSVNNALNLDSEDVIPVSLPSAQTREVITYPTSVSATNLQFRQEFSESVVIDRHVLLTFDEVFYADITASGKNRTVIRHELGTVAPSCWSVMRNCSNLNVQLNNSSLSVQPHHWINAINEYLPEDYHKQFGSMIPSATDLTSSVVEQATEFVNHRVGDNHPYNMRSEGSRWTVSRIQQTVPPVADDNNAVPPVVGTPQTLRVWFSVTMPVPHPWLLFLSQQDKQSLKNVKTFQADFTFGADWLASFQSTAPKDSVGGNCAVALGQDFTASKISLAFRTYLPTESIPQRVAHSYVKWDTARQYVLSNMGTLGSTTTFNTGSIALSQVPSKILLFARPTTCPTINKTDHYAAITQLTINSTSVNGQLTNAKPEQLYQMCQRNGLRMSYQQFRRFRGSPVLIDTVQDLAGMVSGLRQNITLDISGVVENRSASTESVAGVAADIQAYTLFVYMLYDSKIIIGENQAILSDGLSDADVSSLLSQTAGQKALEMASAVGNRAMSQQKGGFLSYMPAVSSALSSYVLPSLKRFARNQLESASQFAKKELGGGVKVF